MPNQAAAKHSPQSALRAVPMGLFPCMGSLQEVVDLAKSKFPTEQHNDVLALLYTYHNTLLEEVKHEVCIGSAS